MLLIGYRKIELKTLVVAKQRLFIYYKKKDNYYNVPPLLLPEKFASMKTKLSWALFLMQQVV